jgi:hypothetical protein
MPNTLEDIHAMIDIQKKSHDIAIKSHVYNKSPSFSQIQSI